MGGAVLLLVIVAVVVALVRRRKARLQAATDRLMARNQENNKGMGVFRYGASGEDTHQHAEYQTGGEIRRPPAAMFSLMASASTTVAVDTPVLWTRSRTPHGHAPPSRQLEVASRSSSESLSDEALEALAQKVGRPTIGLERAPSAAGSASAATHGSYFAAARSLLQRTTPARPVQGQIQQIPASELAVISSSSSDSSTGAALDAQARGETNPFAPGGVSAVTYGSYAAARSLAPGPVPARMGQEERVSTVVTAEDGRVNKTPADVRQRFWSQYIRGKQDRV